MYLASYLQSKGHSWLSIGIMYIAALKHSWKSNTHNKYHRKSCVLFKIHYFTSEA